MVLITRGPTAIDDEANVQALLQKFGGQATSEVIEPTSIFDDTIIVGGQMASPMYARLVQMGKVPSLPYEMVGFGGIFHTTINGHHVWCIAGRSLFDSQGAVNWAVQNGLPYEDVLVPTSDDKFVVKVSIDDPSAISKVASMLPSIRNNIESKLLEYGKVKYISEWFNVQKSTIHFMFKKESQTSMKAVQFIVGAVVVAIIVFIIWLITREIRVAIIEYAEAPVKLQQATNEGLVQQFNAQEKGLQTPEQTQQNISRIISNQAKGLETYKGGITSEIMPIVVIGLVGIGGIIALQSLMRK